MHPHPLDEDSDLQSVPRKKARKAQTEGGESEGEGVPKKKLKKLPGRGGKQLRRIDRHTTSDRKMKRSQYDSKQPPTGGDEMSDLVEDDLSPKLPGRAPSKPAATLSADFLPRDTGSSHPAESVQPEAAATSSAAPKSDSDDGEGIFVNSNRSAKTAKADAVSATLAASGDDSDEGRLLASRAPAATDIHYDTNAKHDEGEDDDDEEDSESQAGPQDMMDHLVNRLGIQMEHTVKERIQFSKRIHDLTAEIEDLKEELEEEKNGAANLEREVGRMQNRIKELEGQAAKSGDGAALEKANTRVKKLEDRIYGARKLLMSDGEE